ncbi:MAG: hypothetical protein EZS28_019720, partial [Streblomastix strix]
TPELPVEYTQKLRDLVYDMMIKDHTKRITLNQLIQVPEINNRIKKYAHEMTGTDSQLVKTYLDYILHGTIPNLAVKEHSSIISSSLNKQTVKIENNATIRKIHKTTISKIHKTTISKLYPPTVIVNLIPSDDINENMENNENKQDDDQQSEEEEQKEEEFESENKQCYKCKRENDESFQQEQKQQFGGDEQYSDVIEIISIDPNSVSFDIKFPAISLQIPGWPGMTLSQLIQMQNKRNYTITISPQIVAGDGVVQIQMKFEDHQKQNRGFRSIGVVDASFEIPEQYTPGYDEFSVGYSGSDGNVMHITQESIEQFIAGNEKYENGDVITLEANMNKDKYKRTLHFFVNGVQQPVSLVQLPESIKFIIQRQNQGTAATIISFQTLPLPSVLKNIAGAFRVDW